MHGGRRLMDETGRRLPDWPDALPDDAIESSQVAFENLVASNEMTTSTVVVRREAQTRAGGFTAATGRSSTDWEMWLRLSLHGAVGATAAPAARYRQHPETHLARHHGGGRAVALQHQGRRAGPGSRRRRDLDLR